MAVWRDIIILYYMMIHKSEADMTNWDEYLPYFLFAYRETPRVTGFPLFELFYGKNVKGLFDILREEWVPTHRTPKSVTVISQNYKVC